MSQPYPAVEEILSLLKSERGIVPKTRPVMVEGNDGRLYVQVVGVRGFPVFTVEAAMIYPSSIPITKTT